MINKDTRFHAKLFYSYSHKDEKYRSNMETVLSQLKSDKLLQDWSDHKILPGKSIPKEIMEKMNHTDIFVFLLSPDFINSDACKEEWKYAKHLENEGKTVFRIPILIRDCTWEDFLKGDNTKGLPKNFLQPISNMEDEDTAWMDVYNGIKSVINELRETYVPKVEFIREMEKIDFFSLEHIKLQDIFEFPTLSYYVPQSKAGTLRIQKIRSQKELLAKECVLIHGEEKSGKTALGRHIFLSIAKNQSVPVLYIDLEEVPRRPIERIFRDEYYRQFSGDYSLWRQQEGKILILDNLSSKSHLIELIEYGKEHFEKIIITLPTDVYVSFFKEDERLTDFDALFIEPLSYKQQETLIRKRLALSNKNEPVPDGRIDQVEEDVNSIITYKKIVPRYPFYVLSILQTYEGFIPDDLTITSYGHCYQVLILTNLQEAGIPYNDNAINTCYNFAEELAFNLYRHTEMHDQTNFDFEGFVEKYNKEYVIPSHILNRLTKSDFGIINNDGSFKHSYMYYFFLGRYLSRRDGKNEDLIKEMCEHSYVTANYLTLLFIIHHTNDNYIIEDILLGTMCTLDRVPPATLNRNETEGFNEIVKALPKNILSNQTVEDERKRERDFRDVGESISGSDEYHEATLDDNPVNDIYRILKNNEIMRQILRNRYGTLEKVRIKEVIEIISESGLRLIKIGLFDKKLITDAARYLHKKHQDLSIEEIRKLLHFVSFIWTMINIRKIVSSINVPDIQDIVNEVVLQEGTPVYDLIGYFNRLYSGEELTISIRRELQDLLKKHDDYFIQRVLSLETQNYMNTHLSESRIEQEVCSALDITYTYKHIK